MFGKALLGLDVALDTHGVTPLFISGCFIVYNTRFPLVVICYSFLPSLILTLICFGEFIGVSFLFLLHLWIRGKLLN